MGRDFCIRSDSIGKKYLATTYFGLIMRRWVTCNHILYLVFKASFYSGLSLLELLYSQELSIENCKSKYTKSIKCPPTSGGSRKFYMGWQEVLAGWHTATAGKYPKQREKRRRHFYFQSLLPLTLHSFPFVPLFFIFYQKANSGIPTRRSEVVQGADCSIKP